MEPDPLQYAVNLAEIESSLREIHIRAKALYRASPSKLENIREILDTMRARLADEVKKLPAVNDRKCPAGTVPCEWGCCVPTQGTRKPILEDEEATFPPDDWAALSEIDTHIKDIHNRMNALYLAEPSVLIAIRIMFDQTRSSLEQQVDSLGDYRCPAGTVKCSWGCCVPTEHP